MTTFFELLNTIHNNNNIYGGTCKRTTPTSQCGSGTSSTSTNNNSNSSNNRKIISIIPELDVTLANEQLLIQVELSGVNKHDIEIDINDSILTIQGEKKKSTNKPEIKATITEKDNTVNSNHHDDNEPSIEEFEDNVKHQKQTTTSSTPTEASHTTKPTKYIQERTFGYFKRHLDLTKLLHQLNLNSINTTFENGLLSITIDKKENYLNSIKIQIN